MDLHKQWIKIIIFLEVIVLIVVFAAGMYRNFTNKTSQDEMTTPVVRDEEEEKLNISKNLRVSRVRFSDEVEAILETMTLQQKIAHMFLISPEALTAVDEVIVAGGICERAVMDYPVGGLEFTSNNYREPVQFERLISGLQAYSQSVIGSDMMVFFHGIETDEEGIDSTSIRTILPNADLVKKGISRNLDYLKIEHSTSADITGDNQLLCSFSAATTNLLREELKYKGIIISGPLNTEQVTSIYSPGEAVIAAIEAGMDVLYHPANFKEAYQAVVTAVENGEISDILIENAVGRILTYTNTNK